MKLDIVKFLGKLCVCDLVRLAFYLSHMHTVRDHGHEGGAD